MAITQISDKSQVHLRRNLERPLEHAEGDGNFDQLENVIEDVSNIINSLGLLDNVPSMIDEKTNKIAQDLQNTSDDLNRRTQAAVDKINQSVDAITEIKRVTDTTHRQLTYAASVYTNEYGEYDDRLLYGIIDTAIKRLRDSLQQNIDNVKNTLHKIAVSGNIEDSNGYLTFDRLSNVPRWIRETHDDGEFLYMRSPDGTQFRLGKTFFDLFNDSGVTSFRVNSHTGDIEAGHIHQSNVYELAAVARDNNYNSLNNLPSLGDAAHRPTFDTGDVNKIPWDGVSLPTTSVCRALKDFIQSVKDGLKGIAWSGNLNDGTGVLDKAHGGRGRGDNSYDGTWFYANGNPSDPSNQGFVMGDNTNNKICGGNDNGDDITQSANVNIDTWWGVAIRSSINKFGTTWKHDARTGTTRQTGDLILLNGDRVVRTESGWLSLSAPSVNLKLGYGTMQMFSDKGHVANIDGNGTAWVGGDFSAARGRFNNQLEVHGGGIEIYGDTPFIDLHFADSSDDYTARLIATARDRVELSTNFTIHGDLQVDGHIYGGGLGGAAYRDFYDNGSLSKLDDLPWGQAVVTTGTLRGILSNMLGDVINIKVKDPESYTGINWGSELVNQNGLMRIKTEIDTYLGSLKGKVPYDTSDIWAFAGDSNELATTKTVATVRNNLSDRINTMSWASGKAAYDTTDAWAFAGDSNEIATTRTLAAVRNNLNSRFDAVKTAPGLNFGDLAGANDYVVTTQQFVNYRNYITSNLITSIRWVRTLDHASMQRNVSYGESNNEIINQIRVGGEVDGDNDFISCSRLQFFMGGGWRTVTT